MVGSLHTWSQVGRLGGEAVVVPGSPDGVELDLEAMVAAIDERTLLVECSHVLFRTGTLVDVQPLVERAQEELHRRGFVVDHRPGVGIRVSPHFYNTLDEALAVLDAMQDLRR